MVMAIKGIMLCCCIFWLASFALAGDNLLTNPGMEQWSGGNCLGWSAVDGATCTQDSTGHTGPNALRIAPSQAYSGVNQNNIPLEAGAQYRLTCWIRGYAAGDVQGIRLMMYSGTTYLPSISTGNLSSASFQQYEYLFTVPAGLTQMNLNIVSFAAPVNGFQFLLDDVRLEKCSSAGSNLSMELWSGNTCSGWSGVDGGSYAQSTVSHGGSYALRVTPTQAYSGINQNNIAFTPGQTYRLTCWIRGTTSADTQPLRLMLYAGGIYLDALDTGNLSTIYQQYTYLFTVPAGLTAPNLNLVTWSAPASGFSFLLDDVVFELISQTGTNPSFEQWSGSPLLPTGWNKVGDSTSLGRSTTARSGTYSASVTSVGLNQGINQAGLAVNANSHYRLRAWLRGGGSGQDDAVCMMITDHGTGGPYYTMVDTQRWCELSDTQWREFALDFWTGPATSSIDIELLAEQYPACNAITFLVDDVGIEPLGVWGNASMPTDLLINANGDFERWSGETATGWSNTLATSTYAQSDVAYSGASSAVVTPTEVYGGIQKTAIAVQGSTTYQFSAWLRGNGTGRINSGDFLGNPGMETWSGAACVDWVGIDGGTCAQSTLMHSGAYGLLITPSYQYSGVNQYSIPCEPGQTYRLTCWLRGLAGSDAQPVRLMMYIGTTYLPAVSTGNLSTTQYQQYEYRYTVPAGVNELNLNVVATQVPQNGFQFLLDDVQIAKISDTGSNLDMETWNNGVGTDWSGIDGGSYAYSTVAHGGAAAIKVTPTTAYSGVNQYDIAVAPQATYRLTCWLRGGATGDTQPLRLIMYSGGTYLTQCTDALSDKVYQPCTMEFTVPAGITLMNLNLCCPVTPPSGFTFLVDDVSLVKLSDPNHDDCVRLLAIDRGASPTLYYQTDTAASGGLVDGQWRRFNLTFTTRPGATQLDLELSAYQYPQTNPLSFQVDHVSLTRLDSNVVDVITLGAIPNDGVDDTQALMAAIDRLKGLSSSTLVFPPGRYDFAQDQNLAAPSNSMFFDDIDNLTVQGHGTFLVGSGLTQLMQFKDCDNIHVDGVSVDFAREPFSVGKVVTNTGSVTSFDVEVFDAYPVSGGEPVQAFLEYDPTTGRPQRGGLDEYSAVTATQLVAPQTLRLYLNKSVSITKDRWMHLRHQVYGYEALRFDHCSNMSVTASNIFCCPGMGIHVTDSQNVSLNGVMMRPRPHTNNLMSTTADGFHCNSTRGQVVVKDCLFEGQGDDGGNIHGIYFGVQSVVNATTLDIYRYAGTSELYLPHVGDTVEFSPANTMVPYGTATVATVTQNYNGTAYHRLTFTAPIPGTVAAGHLVASVTGMPSVRYTRNKVRANRGRGTLASCRDVQITNNQFHYCANGSVLIITEVAAFGESIGADDLYIESNLAQECNYNQGACEGDISVVTYLANWARAAVGAHKDAIIRYNTIKNTGQSGIAVCSTKGDTSNFLIQSNTLNGICMGYRRGEGRYAVYLVNDRYGTISNNTLLNPGAGYLSSVYTAGCSNLTITSNSGF
jgi:hypothetical protein